MTSGWKVVFVFSLLGALALGGAVGFCVGFSSTSFGDRFIEALVSKEAPADTDNPQMYRVRRFELQYPGNWSVDTAADDYDAETDASFESPDSTWVKVIVCDVELDSEDFLTEALDSQETLLSNAVRSRFEWYGKYTGAGAMLRGKFAGSMYRVRCFVLEHGAQTFVVLEWAPEEDLANTQRGLRLIEQSFTCRVLEEEQETEDGDPREQPGEPVEDRPDDGEAPDMTEDGR